MKEINTYRVKCFCICFCSCFPGADLLYDYREVCTLVAVKSTRKQERRCGLVRTVPNVSPSLQWSFLTKGIICKYNSQRKRGGYWICLLRFRTALLPRYVSHRSVSDIIIDSCELQASPNQTVITEAPWYCSDQADSGQSLKAFNCSWLQTTATKSGAVQTWLQEITQLTQATFYRAGPKIHLSPGLPHQAQKSAAVLLPFSFLLSQAGKELNYSHGISLSAQDNVFRTLPTCKARCEPVLLSGLYCTSPSPASPPCLSSATGIL